MPSPLRLLFPDSAVAAPKPRTLQRDVVALAFDDGSAIEVLRVRDPRSRRIRLSVDERGARLTLPPRASLASGERFLHEHREWLRAQVLAHAIDGLAPLLHGMTTHLPLRGEELPVRWCEGRYARVWREGDVVAFQAARAGGGSSDGGRVNDGGPRPTLRRALRDFYEAQARADLGGWLPRYLPGLPRAPSRLRLKVMSSQWGSLAPDGALALDLALVLGRPSAFEYVLVHELCHLIRPDHSRAFWREVEARCPHWRAERDYFHAEGRRLKARLRALLSADDPVSR
jgi:predicted metal-dependent hydrolase